MRPGFDYDSFPGLPLIPFFCTAFSDGHACPSFQLDMRVLHGHPLKVVHFQCWNTQRHSGRCLGLVAQPSDRRCFQLVEVGLAAQRVSSFSAAHVEIGVLFDRKTFRPTEAIFVLWGGGLSQRKKTRQKETNPKAAKTMR